MKRKTKKNITLASLAVASVLALGGAAAMQGSIRGGAETIEPGSKGPIDLYVISGQSNAVGTDTRFAENVKDEWAEKYDTATYSSSVRYWGHVYNDAQDSLYMDFDNTVKFGMGCRATEFGPEVGMSKILGEKRGDREMVIFKSASGASSLADDGELHNTWGDDGLLWQNWQKDLIGVVQHYLAEGYTVNLAGTFWMQGEADSYSQTNIDAYESRLTHLINNMKGVYEDLELGNATTAPFVIGKISHTYDDSTGTRADNNDQIRAAQENVAKAMAQENVVTLDTPDIKGEVSWAHFSCNQMLEIGENVANLMLKQSALTMNAGASVRINAPAGIRFGATLSSDKYAEIIENGAYKDGYKVGMIVVPKSYFDDYNMQTENTDYYSYFSTVKGKMIDLPFEPDQFKENEQTGDYNFYGAITDIYDVNFARDFQAVAYVKNGDAYSYSNVSDARNIQYVAKAAIEAGKLDADQMNSLNTAYNLGGYTALNVTVPTQEEPLSVYVAEAAANVTGADVAAVIHARYGLKVSADGFTKDGAAATAFENNGTYTATIKPTVTVKFANGKTQQLQTVYGEDFAIPADSSTIFETENDCTLSAKELKNLTDDITVTYKVKEELLHKNAGGFAVKFNDESGWTLQSKNAYAAAVVMQGASTSHYAKYTVNKPANEKSEQFGMYVSDGEKYLLFCLWPHTSGSTNRVLNNNAGGDWASLPTYSAGEQAAVAKLFDTNATTLTFEMFLVEGTIYYYTDGVLITSAAVNSTKLAEGNRLDTSKEYTVGFATLGTNFSILNTYTDFEHLVGDEAVEKLQSLPLRYFDASGISNAATITGTDDSVTITTKDQIFGGGYIVGSEQVKGKNFVVETKILTETMEDWATYGFVFKYEGGTLILGASKRGDYLKMHAIVNGNLNTRGEKEFDTTEGKSLRTSYKDQAYLNLKITYVASAKTFLVCGNGAYLCSVSHDDITKFIRTNTLKDESWDGLKDFGDIVKIGLGGHLSGGRTTEFKDCKYSAENVVETEVNVNFSQGYYNSNDGNTMSYGTLWKATQKFTRETLPVGSVIYVASGWNYRPEAWVDGKGTGRPDNVTVQWVVVTEAWWGNYTERAFNVFIPGNVDCTKKTQEEMESIFKIYLPNN